MAWWCGGFGGIVEWWKNGMVDAWSGEVKDWWSGRLVERVKVNKKDKMDSPKDGLETWRQTLMLPLIHPLLLHNVY